MCMYIHCYNDWVGDGGVGGYSTTALGLAPVVDSMIVSINYCFFRLTFITNTSQDAILLLRVAVTKYTEFKGEVLLSLYVSHNLYINYPIPHG